MPNTNLYGFHDLKHLANERVTNSIVAEVDRAVSRTLAEFNRVLDELMADWVEVSTTAQEQIALENSGTHQPLDEHGNPKPTRPSGYYQVGYPVHGGGSAWGDDRITRALMTVGEVERNLANVMQRDKDWMIRHLLAAVLDNVPWTFNDIYPSVLGQRGLGNITVQPLASGDAVTYGRKGFQLPATDTHYLAQASAISDANNPFPAIRAELLEHPSNMNGNVVAYVATDLVAAIGGLAAFVPVGDPRVNYGDNTTLAVGSEFGGTGPGDTMLGVVNRVRVVEWSALPAGYIVAKMEGKPFVRMRHLPAADLQGLFEERHSPDGNHRVYRYLRWAGFGIFDRTAAVVQYVGSGTYAIPSGYDAPLAV